MSKIEIKWAELSEQIRLRYIQEAIVTRQLGNCSARSTEVWYEDVFFGDRLSALDKISQLARRQINLNKFNHEKLGSVYSDLLPDFDKLKELYLSERWDRLW